MFWDMDFKFVLLTIYINFDYIQTNFEVIRLKLATLS